MWQYIPAVLSAISTISQTSSANEQNKNQMAWGRYNATMQYNTTMGNLGLQTKLAGMQAGFSMAAANMQISLAKQQFGLSRKAAQLEDQKVLYNNAVLLETNGYNNALLDAEIADVWESAELDIVHLENARARERGEVAVQNFQGVEKEGGSFEDTMVDSMTQEYLDVFVVEKGAADKATDINREVAKNHFNTKLLMQQTAWEGKLAKYNILLGAQANYMNAVSGAQSTLLQGAANLAGASMGIQAGANSAKSAYQAGVLGAQFNYDYNRTNIRNDFTAGLFGAAGSGISTYYGSKQPQSNYNFITAGASGAPQSTVLNTSGGGMQTTRNFSNGYQAKGTLADSGSSLFSSGL